MTQQSLECATGGDVFNASITCARHSHGFACTGYHTIKHFQQSRGAFVQTF